jgi:hypothetical protein
LAPPWVRQYPRRPRSFIIGFAVVALFMIFYYGLSGLFADIALIVNMGFIMAALTMLEPRSPCPYRRSHPHHRYGGGPNVLIFERIREGELRTGKTVRRLSTRASPAIITILDSTLPRSSRLGCSISLAPAR